MLEKESACKSLSANISQGVCTCPASPTRSPHPLACLQTLQERKNGWVGELGEGISTRIYSAKQRQLEEDRGRDRVRVSVLFRCHGEMKQRSKFKVCLSHAMPHCHASMITIVLYVKYSKAEIYISLRRLKKESCLPYFHVQNPSHSS